MGAIERSPVARVQPLGLADGADQWPNGTPSTESIGIVGTWEISRTVSYVLAVEPSTLSISAITSPRRGRSAANAGNRSWG